MLRIGLLWVTGLPMRTATAAISEVNYNGVTRYRVTFPTANGRKREVYVSRKRAEVRLKEILADQEQFGKSVSAMTSTTRADAVAAEQILKGSGLTLVEIARAAMEQKRKDEAGKPISEAVAAFLVDRIGKADSYIETLQPRLEYISNFFAGKTTTGIKTPDCKRLLDSLARTSSPQTVSHYRTHLSVLFNFCIEEEWLTINPAEGVKLPADVITAKAEILTPQEAAALLSACDPTILPGVVIGMFCGLRQAEIERLDWKKVDLVDEAITIDEDVAKTNSRRVCPIPKNARAWLAPYAKESGNVWPADKFTARDLWTLARVQAGYGPFAITSNAVRDAQLDPATEKPRKDLRPWPANALRHTAISYKVAKDPDLPRIGYESGNSPKMITKHYDGLAKKRDVEAFFSILPTAPANVTQFKAA